jgi:protein-disulfide isomerase/uncharacterized membrane protein
MSVSAVSPASIPTASDGLARENQPGGTGLNAAALIAAFVGLFAASVLSVGHGFDYPVPCGGSPDCASVAAHPISRFLGVPIAYFGVAAFLTLISLLGRPVVGRRARLVAMVLASLGMLASTGLLLYSKTIIQATCSWCVVSGVAMSCLFFLNLALIRRTVLTGGTHPCLTWSLGILTAITLGVQTGRMERAALAAPVPADRLAQIKTVDLLDSANSRGPTDALITITIFADFLCPACRSALSSLLVYQQVNPRDVRLVYRHLPLWQIRGHETSKAAAALSEMAAESGKFWEFAHSIHLQPAHLTRDTYLEVMRILGYEPSAVEARLNDSTDRALISVQRDIALAEQLGIRATPTFIVQVGANAPVSATQPGLKRILNSKPVIELLMARTRARQSGL